MGALVEAASQLQGPRGGILASAAGTAAALANMPRLPHSGADIW